MKMKYTIESSNIVISGDFLFYTLGHCKSKYGLDIGHDSWSADEDYFDQALLENEIFMDAVEEEGYEERLRTHSPSSVYEDLTGTDLDNLLSMFEEEINGGSELGAFYDNFKAQAEEIERYLSNNDNINILEDNREDDDEFDVFYVVEFDESLLNEVETFLNKTNSDTENKNNQTVLCEYYETEYDTEVFAAEFSNMGSLEVVITKAQ